VFLQDRANFNRRAAPALVQGTIEIVVGAALPIGLGVTHEDQLFHYGIKFPDLIEVMLHNGYRPDKFPSA
jgi:hypothetical protein